MPRYQDIARQLKTAIEQGELKPGARLPSSRTWSQELGVSRSTVENAYAELVAQGWLIRRGQAGTFVSERIYPQQSTVQVVDFAGESQQPLPFQMGLPALDLFPRELWARVMGRRLRTQTRFDLALGDVCGEVALREAIVDYLRISRGIDCQPEQVFITHGYAASIALILHALAKPGNGMWIEDPGFPLIRPIVTRHDVEILPVPVDDNGLDITSGIQNYPDARFALITPAHQSPLGVALSLARRHQILEWADRSQAWIIEDDYDSEFRYHGKPLPALKKSRRTAAGNLCRNIQQSAISCIALCVAGGAGEANCTIPPPGVTGSMCGTCSMAEHTGRLSSRGAFLAASEENASALCSTSAMD